MMQHRAPHTVLGVLFAFALLLVLGGGEILCAADDDCGASDRCGGGSCGNEDGCALCGCSCRVPTVLIDEAGAECPLAPAGTVALSHARPSDGIPVSIVRPPA